MFPTFTDNDIDSITGGPYLRKKGKAYIQMVLEKFQVRTSNRENRNQSLGPASTTQSQIPFSYAIHLLHDHKNKQHFEAETFTNVVRMDIPSYHSKYRKFKVMVGIRKLGDQTAKFAFGCTCSCGNRSSPCVHGVIAVMIFTSVLKPQNEAMEV